MLILKLSIGVIISISCSKGKLYLSETSDDKPRLENGSDYADHIENPFLGKPFLIRKAAKCSKVGADGRKRGLGKLVKIEILWGNKVQIKICHDEKVYGTIWTNYIIDGKNIDNAEMGGGRPQFKTDDGKTKFYNWTTTSELEKIYSKKVQKRVMNKILGKGNPIDTKGQNYLAKGHLAPDAAFVYQNLQDSTYFYFNAAPQFQAFNNGNWKSLESSLRKLGSKLGKDLNVYTGTHQILEYEGKKLYLQNDKRFIPVPKYYWTVVVDESSKKAAAIIGLNDIHAKKAPPKLCNDRCGEMKWVKSDNYNDVKKGFMYCCDLKNAAKAIPAIKSIPKLPKSAGLIN